MTRRQEQQYSKAGWRKHDHIHIVALASDAAPSSTIPQEWLCEIERHCSAVAARMRFTGAVPYPEAFSGSHRKGIGSAALIFSPSTLWAIEIHPTHGLSSHFPVLSFSKTFHWYSAQRLPHHVEMPVNANVCFSFKYTSESVNRSVTPRNCSFTAFEPVPQRS